MTDLEFEKMMIERSTWDSRTLILYTDNELIKPSYTPYLTCAYLTNENYKYFNKVILEEYTFIFIVCKNSDDMNTINIIYNLASESVFVIPIILIDTPNTDYLYENIFSSAILISQVEYKKNTLIISDNIKLIWESMFHGLTTKNIDNDVLTEYADVRYILSTEGITISKYISHNSLSIMENNLIEIFNSKFFPKNVKSILITLQINSNFPMIKIVNIIEIFYEINPNVEIVWSANVNDNLEDDFIRLKYFLCGLTFTEYSNIS